MTEVRNFILPCDNHDNCYYSEWKFNNLNKAFDQLIIICSQLPRTEILFQNSSYWHGLCKSLLFRFPDDLKIQKVPELDIIKVKSNSRTGVLDLGVNKNRVASIYKQFSAINHDLII